MHLTPGERLEGAGPETQPGGYVVTGVVQETAWSTLYVARKVFYNFDFTGKRVRETDDKEWLDVLLRTIRYPTLENAEYVAQRRALARAEVRAILGGRHSNLWPEPIDLLEVENNRDAFGFAPGQRDTEPIVVFARPHGDFLPEWQKQILPVTGILSVLAELLEFVGQAHEEGLLLLGLGPQAVVVDPLERAHYVGTDMALSQKSALLQDITPHEVWSRLFPPERFPSGFAAPECYQAGSRPDQRSDVYAWATLAYDLITGHSPAQVALEQGRPWAQFTNGHFLRLEKTLKQFPLANVEAWAEQLGLPAEALLRNWPAKLVDVMRLALSPLPARRPRTAGELRSWLVSLPPPAVAGMVALQLEQGEGRLLLDCSALDVNLRLVIRRNAGTPPTSPSDGEPVYEGPLRPVVTDKQLATPPLFYTAFTAKLDAGQIVHSPGVTEALWQPSPPVLRQWMEHQAATVFEEQEVPARVGMVLGALDPVAVAQTLQPSDSPRVRGWGLRRLEQALKAKMPFGQAEPVLWQYLRDPLSGLRQEAALDLWAYAPAKGDELLLRILEALEAVPVDVPVALGHFLRDLGLNAVQADWALRGLEQRRPSACLVCGEPITFGARSTHLRSAHGYVEYDGDVLPPAVVVERLWDRVLYKNDGQAHEQLVELYRAGAPNGQGGAGLPHYVADLERLIFGKSKAGAAGPTVAPYTAVESYLAFLRRSQALMPVTQLLLRSANGRLKELGRSALLPILAERLKKGPPGPASIAQALESICPDQDLIDERIALCGRLPTLGVDQASASACAAQLQEERLVPCTECAALVRSRDLETHLRRAHQVYEFRGVRRSYDDTRTFLLDSVCAAPPDVRAWHSLLAFIGEKYPGDADRHLVIWLYLHLKPQDGEAFDRAAEGLSEAMATLGDRLGSVAPILTGPAKNETYALIGKRLALEIAGRAAPPVPAEVVEGVRPLLALKVLPRKSRDRAVLSLLRTTGRDGPATMGLLRAYVESSSKVRAVEKLQQLEQRFGQAPAIDRLRQEIEDEVRMSCPRCPTQLPRKQMVGHLWERHRLVLDGQRVREPWRVLEDWAVDYGLEKDAALLERCRELARRADPEAGLNRLHRMMLRHGAQDREVLNSLAAEAKLRRTALCPHCYGQAPVTEPPPPEPLDIHGRELAGYGYTIKVSNGGIFPGLAIETEDEILYSAREPGRGLTRFGAFLLVILPILFGLTLLLSLMLWIIGVEHAIPIAAMLGAGLGLLLSGLLFAIWPGPPPTDDRLLKAAWNMLVPHILADPLDRPQWSLLYGLAVLSSEEDVHRPRLAQLTECLELAGQSLRTDPAAGHALAALCRLYVPELHAAGRDVVAFIAAQAGECLAGKVSLVLLRTLMEQVALLRHEWSKGQMLRLRLLIAERAFGAGHGIDDLMDFGRAVPSFAAVLGLEDRWRWAQLAQLFTSRSHRPWEKFGGLASTVFELLGVAYEGEDFLEQFSDVLLCVRRAQFHITSRGVWVQGCLIGSMPAPEQISWEYLADQREYEIRIGTQKLRVAKHAKELVTELRGWLHFYFNEFLPRLPTSRGRASDVAQRVWYLHRATCPECGKSLVPCLGDVGIAVR